MHEMGLHLAIMKPHSWHRVALRGARQQCLWPCSALLAALAACTTLPPAFAALEWTDQWGDRGRGVLGRDFGMCSELVESHRSQLADCMAARGWTIGR